MTKGADKWSVLLTSTLGSFLTAFMSSAVNIALPSISSELSLDALTLGWISTSYILASAVFLIPFGRIADIHGRKKVFAYGVSVFTFSSLLTAFSTSNITLISFRILQGIGSAMIFGTGIAMLTSAFPLVERGKALGLNITAVYIGLSLGPFLGGTLTQFLGWRSIFLTSVPLGLLILIVVFLRLNEEWIEARGERFDFVGSTIYGFTLTTIIYGLSLLPQAEGIIFVSIGALGFLAFLRWELREKSPILEVRIFKNNLAFSLSSLAALISYGATFAVGFILSLYLQYIKSLDPETAGLLLATQSLVQAVLSPFAGRLSDKIEPRIVASLGLGLTAIGLFMFTFLGSTTSLEFIIGVLLLLGSGYAFFSSPNTNAIMSSVERRFYGVASGMVGTMRLIGQMLSISIITLIFAIYIGQTQIMPEFYPAFLVSIEAAFKIFAALCLVGMFASFARGKVR